MRGLSIFWMVVCLAAASSLYSVKYRVQAMDSDLAKIHAQISEETVSLHVLHAEWTYLTRPERLRQLTQQMGIASMNGSQMADLASLPFVQTSGVQLANAVETKKAAQKMAQSEAQVVGMLDDRERGYGKR